MPVEPTPDNPHGWGYIDTRKKLPHYQLSPRIQIVIGDVIKISQGTYWDSEEGGKVSIDKMRGEWTVKGIYEGDDGNIELDVTEHGRAMLTRSCTIRVTGGETPSPTVSSLTRRPYKVKLARPRFKRKRRQKPVVQKVEKVEEVDWDAIKDIVGDIEDEA